MAPKQERAYEQKRAEKELVRAMAFDVAARYCRENGLSVEKLRQQRFAFFENTAWFSQPSDVVPDGLLNDIQTIPHPTLIIKLADDKLMVEQTEYTAKDLANNGLE
nr:hypothetical protein [bacterium]